MSLDDYEILAPIAYQGKPDCMDVRCRRMLYQEEPRIRPGCLGYHCSYCDEPCSMMGHKCDASQTLIEAARKIKDGG